MAGNSLNLTDTIAANGQYTFTFTSDGVWKLTPEDAIARIGEAGLPINGISADYSGGLLATGLFGDTLNVAFTWTQAGWSVQQVAQNLEAALDNGVIGHYTYVQGVGGFNSSTIWSQIKALLGESGGTDNSSIWSWVVIVIIVLLIVGGAFFTTDLAHIAAKNAGKRL